MTGRSRGIGWGIAEDLACEGASVVIASTAGVVGEPRHAAYSTSKGALLALTRALAIELAGYGIRDHAVSPGPVFSDMRMAALSPERDGAVLAEFTPLQRLGRIVLHLASDEAGWWTGQAVGMDGGLSVLK